MNKLDVIQFALKRYKSVFYLEDGTIVKIYYSMQAYDCMGYEKSVTIEKDGVEKTWGGPKTWGMNWEAKYRQGLAWAELDNECENVVIYYKETEESERREVYRFKVSHVIKIECESESGNHIWRFNLRIYATAEVYERTKLIRDLEKANLDDLLEF